MPLSTIFQLYRGGIVDYVCTIRNKWVFFKMILCDNFFFKAYYNLTNIEDTCSVIHI